MTRSQAFWIVLLTAFVTYVFLAGGGLPRLRELAGAPGERTRSAAPNPVSERHRLFMMTALAFVELGRDRTPKPGSDIAALVAIDVEDVTGTPPFVLARNRIFEEETAIAHAEMEVIERAFARFSREHSQRGIDESLAKATMYTTLESCPMCAGAALIARIPRILWCVDDPSLREPGTHARRIPQVTEVFGRRTLFRQSNYSLCREANREMWRVAEGPADGRYVFFSREAGATWMHITRYLADEGEKIFGPARDELFSYVARFDENATLLSRLRRAVTRHHGRTSGALVTKNGFIVASREEPEARRP